MSLQSKLLRVSGKKGYDKRGAKPHLPARQSSRASKHRPPRPQARSAAAAGVATPCLARPWASPCRPSPCTAITGAGNDSVPRRCSLQKKKKNGPGARKERGENKSKCRSKGRSGVNSHRTGFPIDVEAFTNKNAAPKPSIRMFLHVCNPNIIRPNTYCRTDSILPSLVSGTHHRLVLYWRRRWRRTTKRVIFVYICLS